MTHSTLEGSPFASQSTGLDAELPASPSLTGSSGRLFTSYEITAEDRVAGWIHQHALSVSPLYRRWWWAMTIGFVVILWLLMLPTVLRIAAGHDGGRPSVWGITFLACVAFLLIISSPWGRRRAIKKSMLLLTQKHAAEFLGPITVSIEPAGITGRCPNRQGFRRWEDVQRIDVVGDHAMIFNGNLVIYTIPLRAFPTRDGFESFVSLARAYKSEVDKRVPISEFSLPIQRTQCTTSLATWLVVIFICFVLILTVLTTQLPPGLRE